MGTTSKGTRRGSSVGTTGGGAGDARLVKLHEQVTVGVAALVASEGWRSMLEVAARFHRYSLGNVLLIGAQAPAATRVAGFRTWQGLGRQVCRGERGIAILAPCTYRTPGTTGTGTTAAVAHPGELAGGVAGDVATATARGGRRLGGFRVVYVFDVAQTEGTPLPEVAPALLQGQAPVGLWQDLAGQVAGHGYTLERGDCSGANGHTDPARRVVRVRGDVDDAQAVKTLAHELGHIQCGHVVDVSTYSVCRGRFEVEAESVAYLVAAVAGLDTGGYTFPYLAGWAGGDPELVRRSADTVLAAARTVLSRSEVAAGPAGADDDATDTA